MKPMTEDLNNIEALCTKYEFHFHARLAATARQALEQGTDIYRENLNTVDWWGGAGSMVDVFLHGNSSVSEEEQKEDNTKLSKALLSVLRQMQAAGVHNPRLDQVASSLQNLLPGA